MLSFQRRFFASSPFSSQLSKCKSFPEIESTVLSQAHFSGPDFITAMKKLVGKRSTSKSAAMDKLISASSNVEFSPSELASCFQALAVSNIRPIPKEFYSHLLKTKVSSFSSRDLSKTLVSLAKSKRNGEEDPTAVSTLVQEIQTRPLADFYPNDFSHMMWSMGVLNPSQALVDFCSQAIVNLKDKTELTPSSLAQTMWACSKLKLKNTPVMEVCVGEVLSRPDFRQFSMGELLCVLSASSKLLTDSKKVAEAIAREFLKRDLTSVSPSNIALSMRAFGQSGIPNVQVKQELVNLVAKEIKKCEGRKFRVQDWTTVLLAFSQLDSLKEKPVADLFAMKYSLNEGKQHLSVFKALDEVIQLWQKAHPGNRSLLLESLGATTKI